MNKEKYDLAKKEIDTNTLLVVQGNNNPLLFSSSLETKNLHLINKIEDGEFKGTAKVRYRQNDQKCSIRIVNNTLKIKFDDPQRSITPGQSVVIYKDNICLGGGEIAYIA